MQRYRPYRFPNAKIAPNRVVVPPMASQTADEQGFVTPQTLRHYERLVESGAGLIFVEYSHVHLRGRGERNQLGAYSDAHIPGLAQIAKALHQGGALAGLQLVHAGGKSTEELTGGPLMGPSAIAVPVKGWQPATPVALSQAEVCEWIQAFVQAAGRAAAAGFDLVELHAAHGYGLNQWLSRLTNQREDIYGGSLVGRSRLLLEIVREIKKSYPQILLAVRMPGQDHLPGGLTISDAQWIAGQLESAGVDLLDVSSGIGGWRRPEGRQGQGYLVADAAQIKAATSLPVIGVGGIEAGEFIDEIVDGQRVDFAAVGRAILQDPQAWYQKNLNKPRDAAQGNHAVPPGLPEFCAGLK